MILTHGYVIRMRDYLNTRYVILVTPGSFTDYFYMPIYEKIAILIL